MEPAIPTLQNILLCERIITEKGTEKKTLIGIFDRITTNATPVTLPAFWIYARMSDAHGKYHFKLTMRFFEDLMEEGKILIGMNVPDGPGNVDLAIQLPPTLFKRPGEYVFEIYSNEILIGNTILSVVVKKN